MSPPMSLDENFLLIWRQFLEMEIIRSQHCLKLTGSANAYLVLQVICWHHFLLVSEDLEETSLDATLEGWFTLSKQPGSKGKKLTYALIADLTGLDKETVRRNVKVLSSRGFVTADRKQGVVFSPTDKRNNEIVNLLNATERRLVLQFHRRWSAMGGCQPCRTSCPAGSAGLDETRHFNDQNFAVCCRGKIDPVLP